MSFHDAPGEECDRGYGHHDGLHNEEMATEEGSVMAPQGGMGVLTFCAQGTK
jgi:hypothetical protein